MDAYWKEYISRRDRFTPPHESFRPSVEVTSEILYRTPLIDSHMPTRRSSKPVSMPDTPIVESLKPHAEDDPRYYVIDEEADVDELVLQIKESGKFDE